ncbi:histidinol dehydrogenase [Aliifodinibius salipaludis]|uniref:Histidinol dehydrogenase n=1 Tax=Fodinibius salipaludis TaxID=2032627 RepID=A0A2A2G9X2_9BACT|nr:histidinol dehydrogenase [Aliifodinibius salipaludis]PAU93663.1 histidinol dehydrogenase [Aliifodinibius salipaludis]
MKKYSYKDLSADDLNLLCQRPKMDFRSIFGQVEPIIEKVEREGDAGINYYNQKFDGAAPDPIVINPQQKKVSLDSEIKQALDTAFDNIYRFHEAQLPAPLEVETMPGVQCKRVARPIERVGLYIPGGTAILPSTLMMLGIPAMLAGCSTIVVATPPKSDGSVADEILYLAKKIGATHLLKAGGAQAVAGMALGTESVPKVDKILGPGNQYVTVAKMMLQNSEAQIAIDMPAGPSEVLVIADGTANPAFVAADLLSQAEHGEDSQVVLVATNDFDLNICLQAIEHQLTELPRQEIARKSIEQSFSVTVNNLDEALDFSNRYAPEHLILQCQNPELYEDQIMNAGSVFLGKWTPESAGDYASGTNHTLPTYGYARMFSGVSVDSFLKQITMQQITANGLKNVGPVIEKLAELEELEAHKNAVSIRLKEIKKNI